jgi:hypothetical protein
MGDVEDPYLYAGFPISEWQQTEKGQWVMQHAKSEPVFHCTPCMESFGYRVTITGTLDAHDELIFRLKWG